MNINLKVLSARLKTIVSVLVAGLSVMAFPALAASSAELLEKAIYYEETKGDLQAAVQVYKDILADSAVDRAFTAQAQLRLGLCHLKLGQQSQAVAALDKLTADYPDKQQLLALVEAQMPSLLDEIVRQVEQNYISELDRAELVETAIRAIAGKVESEFIGEDQLVTLNQQMEQQLGGIGAALKFDKTNRHLFVETPLRGSPALKAGVRPGDRIVGINGQPVAGLPEGKELERAIKLLQGRPGEVVTAEIQHAGSDEVEPLHITRDVIRLPTVLGDYHRADQSAEYMLTPTIGYVRITSVGRRTPEEVRSALDALVARGLKGLVLDLRNNPGGLLHEATVICDLFLEQGTIVTVKGRGEPRTFTASAPGTFSGFPIVVLVNRKTASAAEIIVAGLQDHGRAIVVGERTFGQGLVRSLLKLEGGRTALKLPTAAYYRPNGRNMHRYTDSADSDDWGVRPNENWEVAFTDEETQQYAQWRHERDKLNTDDPPRPAFHDRQLLRALEYFR